MPEAGLSDWRADKVPPLPRLGQHFLLSPATLQRIAQSALPIDKAIVCDIGAGTGLLSHRLLMEGAYHVVAVENDPRCLLSLQRLKTCAGERMTIYSEDILKVDVCQRIRHRHGPSKPIKIVANIPYHLSAPLFGLWLDGWRDYAGITVTAQKEVVCRLAATTGRNYGRLSVAVQRLFEVTPLFKIKRTAFTPPPQVESQVVRLIPRDKPQVCLDAGILDHVLRAAFGKRRKMLKSALKDLVAEKEALEKLLVATGIDGTKRAQDIAAQDFYRLARTYESWEAANR
ncbi:MAG: ribosomal RNA small subunit methyltransferase A [Alphaproteobacteria bacterium GM202ARS2]|nr:ribosomal RNA small subunit methyltransferase A [Alphaproteobacteria bacterium GM202ARS2]